MYNAVVSVITIQQSTRKVIINKIHLSNLIFSMKRATYENDLLHSAFVQRLGKDIHVKIEVSINT